MTTYTIQIYTSAEPENTNFINTGPYINKDIISNMTVQELIDNGIVEVL